MRKFGESWWDRHYRLLVWSLFATFALLMIHAFELKLIPVFSRAADMYSKNITNEIINQELQQTLSHFQGEFSEVERDKNGEVLSIGLDAVKVNRLKSELALRLIEAFKKVSAKEFTIPLGTVMGGALLNGRGPGLPFLIKPYSSCDVRFEQSFSSVGINQSVYRVRLIVEADVSSILGKRDQSTLVRSEFLLEERMISGKVPQTYLKRN